MAKKRHRIKGEGTVTLRKDGRFEEKSRRVASSAFCRRLFVLGRSVSYSTVSRTGSISPTQRAGQALARP